MSFFFEEQVLISLTVKERGEWRWVAIKAGSLLFSTMPTNLTYFFQTHLFSTGLEGFFFHLRGYLNTQAVCNFLTLNSADRTWGQQKRWHMIGSDISLFWQEDPAEKIVLINSLSYFPSSLPKWVQQNYCQFEILLPKWFVTTSFSFYQVSSMSFDITLHEFKSHCKCWIIVILLPFTFLFCQRWAEGGGRLSLRSPSVIKTPHSLPD